jgi:hypothetical protein
MSQRGFGAGAFLAIVRCVPRLARLLGHPVEVGAIAVQRVGRFERVGSLPCQIAVIARAKADDGETPAHGLVSQPGTSTMAK